MTRCAKCGRECSRDPRQGIMQWCPRCPPAKEHRYDGPTTVHSNTKWQGGQVKKAPNLDDVEEKA